MTSPHFGPNPAPRNSATLWIVAIALGVAAVFGLIFFGNYARDNVAATDQPAVTAIPAPAMKRAPPAPETTTGQRASPAQPQQ